MRSKKFCGSVVAVRSWRRELVMTYANEVGTAWVTNLLLSLREVGIEHTLAVTFPENYKGGFADVMHVPREDCEEDFVAHRTYHSLDCSHCIQHGVTLDSNCGLAKISAGRNVRRTRKTKMHQCCTGSEH